MIECDCYAIALSVGLPLVLLVFLGQISNYVICRLIEEHLWPRIKTSGGPPIVKKHPRVDSISEASDEESETDSSLSSSITSSGPSSETPSPIVTPTAEDSPPAPFISATPIVTPIIANGSAQQRLAEHNLQLSMLRDNIMALVPLVEQKVATTSEISESNKKTLLSLIDSFAGASSSLTLPPLPAVPINVTSSNSILDSPRDLSDEQRREEESQYLMNTLATLTDLQQ